MSYLYLVYVNLKIVKNNNISISHYVLDVNVGEQVQAEMSTNLYLARVHCVNLTGLIKYFGLKLSKKD